MSKTREEAIQILKNKRAKYLVQMKELIKKLDSDKPCFIRAGQVKRVSVKYYDFSKKIHQLESDYKDYKDSFLPEIYLIHYASYIAHSKSTTELEQDVSEASLSLEDPYILPEYKEYWTSKKEIAERFIKYKNSNYIP